MFGYAAAEVLGKPMEELIVPPSLRARHRKGMKRYLARGRRADSRAEDRDDCDARGRNGVPGGDRDRADSERRPPLFTGHVRDLTERRRWEEGLQKAREELDRKVERRMQAGGYIRADVPRVDSAASRGEGKADKEIGVTLGISSADSEQACRADPAQNGRVFADRGGGAGDPEEDRGIGFPAYLIIGIDGTYIGDGRCASHPPFRAAGWNCSGTGPPKYGSGRERVRSRSRPTFFWAQRFPRLRCSRACVT